MSKKRRKNIDRHFPAKATYLIECGALPVEFVRALEKLHEYRNSIQHDDIVVPETLACAVQCYAYMALSMMAAFRPRWMRITSENAEILDKYSSNPQSSSLELQANVAQQMMAEHGIGGANSAGQVVADFLASRLEDFEQSLTWIAEFFGWDRTPGWDTAATLHLIQLGPETEIEIDQPKVVRAARVAFDVSEWQTVTNKINGLRSTHSDPHAFGQFADIDDLLAPAETIVHDLVGEIDAYVQSEVDRARGK